MLENGPDPLFSVALLYVALITVTLNQPSAKKIFTNNLVELECVITGQNQATVNEVTITWQIDGQNVNGTETREPRRGQYSKTSKITRSRSEWQSVNKVRCSANRDDMTPVIQDLTVHRGGRLLSDGD